MSDFDQAFEKLMQKIADEAVTADLLAKIDAAKVLQPYYALRKKHKPEKPGSNTMEALRDKIKLAGGTDYEPDSAA
jgi:hypothetical protein